MGRLFGRISIVVVSIIIALILFFSGFREIRDGYMGVEISKIGKYRVLPKPLRAGWYWRRPFMVEFEQYSMIERNIYESREVLSKNKKKITVSLYVYFKLNKEKLVEVHKNFGSDYKIREQVKNITVSLIGSITKDYSREEIFSSKRNVIVNAIHQSLKDKFYEVGIEFTKIIVSDISYPGHYVKELQINFPSTITPLRLTHKCLSKEKSRIDLTGVVYYYFHAKDAEKAYKVLGQNYVQGFLKSKVKEAFHKSSSIYSLEEIFMSQGRKQLVDTIGKTLKAELAEYYIQISNVVIESVNFEAKYQEQLEQIAITQKEVEKAKMLLVKEKEMAKLTRFQEDERLQAFRRKEQLENDMQKLKAKTFKEAEILKAEGKAAALIKIQKIIKENPELMQYMFIEKISDKVKVMVVPSKNGKIMLDSLKNELKK